MSIVRFFCFWSAIEVEISNKLFQFMYKVLRILLTKSETKRSTKKSDPIFRCTTPSTGKRFGEVVVGTLY